MTNKSIIIILLALLPWAASGQSRKDSISIFGSVADQIICQRTMDNETESLRHAGPGEQPTIQHQCTGAHRDMDKLHEKICHAHHQLQIHTKTKKIILKK